MISIHSMIQVSRFPSFPRQPPDPDLYGNHDLSREPTPRPQATHALVVVLLPSSTRILKFACINQPSKKKSNPGPLTPCREYAAKPPRCSKCVAGCERLPQAPPILEMKNSQPNSKRPPEKIKKQCKGNKRVVSKGWMVDD